MGKVRNKFWLNFTKIAIINLNIALYRFTDYDDIPLIKVSDRISVFDIFKLLKSQMIYRCFSFYP